MHSAQLFRPAARNALLAVLLILIAACSGSDTAQRADTTGAGENARFVSGASGTAKLVYQPNVRRVEREDALRSLVGVSADGSTLLFAPTLVAVQGVKAGDVLVLKGLFARKVLAADTDGSVIAVLTGSTSLGEIVRDGHIHIDAPFRFSPTVAQLEPLAPRSVLESLLDTAVPTAHADVAKDAVDLAQKAKKLGSEAVSVIKDDWKAEYSVTPGAGRLDLVLTLTRDIGGFRGLITGTGYLADFGLQSDIEVEQGTIEKLEAAFKRVNGLMNVTWEVAKETPGPFDKQSQIKLPGAITVPLYQLLDGLPVFMEVSAAIIVQPFITGGKQYSHGAFRITYDGMQHFEIKEGTIDPDGNVTGDLKFVEDQHISALAPLGMVVSLAAPRIELTLDPLRVLSDLSALQSTMKKAAAGADEWMNRLSKALQGTELGSDIERARAAAGDTSATKIVESMKSNAMAYIQVVATNGTSHSGLSAITPCTRTELGLKVMVGAAAQAFGQKVAPVSHTIFEKNAKRIDPPTVRLCDF